MTSATSAVLTDLTAEQDSLDAVLVPLGDSGWGTPTPAEGWTVLDTIGHLAFFDERVAVAASDPERFTAELGEVLSDYEAYLRRGPERAQGLGGAATLGWWRAARSAAADALLAVPAGTRVPWYGPAMSVASAATARLMETWAHGQDVVDGLGLLRRPTSRLRHVALLGQKALANSFIAHGLPVPAEQVRVELVGPDGDAWVFGPDDTGHLVSGPALDFCLLMTQRRHRADLSLVATAGLADEWLDVAQAFAGPPGSKRPPSS
jgi:uncharacterized protein (TIGR03084 family)